MEEQMNTAKNLLLIAGITITGITACNYTVGECWPVGQGGGSSGETVTAGGGVILPTGPSGGGGFGNEPPEQPQGGSELKCNSEEEEDTKDPCSGGGDTDGNYVVCSNPCPQNDAQCMSGNISYFRPSNFNFVTIVADDGKDAGGGWQEAKTALAFAHNLFEIVTCQVRVGMPLRTKLLGPISSSIAATHSATAANTAAAKVWPTDLPAGIFCVTFKDEFKKQLESINGLGATLLSP
jgi:hypothetical protein